MALAPSTAVLGVAVFVAGLAVGPLAPTIVSVAGDRYPRQMGAAIGLLLSIAQIGGMVLPWLTGRATIAYGYRAGLVVPALAAFGVAAGTVLAWQARSRRAGVVRRGDREMTPLVLFDLDGTLVDTTDLILQSFAHAFDAHLPGRLPSRRDLVATFGRSLPAALHELAAESGAADPRIAGRRDAGHLPRLPAPASRHADSAVRRHRGGVVGARTPAAIASASSPARCSTSRDAACACSIWSATSTSRCSTTT